MFDPSLLQRWQFDFCNSFNQIRTIPTIFSSSLKVLHLIMAQMQSILGLMTITHAPGSPIRHHKYKLNFEIGCPDAKPDFRVTTANVDLAEALCRSHDMYTYILYPISFFFFSLSLSVFKMAITCSKIQLPNLLRGDHDQLQFFLNDFEKSSCRR